MRKKGLLQELVANRSEEKNITEEVSENVETLSSLESELKMAGGLESAELDSDKPKNRRDPHAPSWLNYEERAAYMDCRGPYI